MKKLLSFLFAFTGFGLAGCLDVQEDFSINADGTGVYKTTADMSGMWDMLQMAAMMDTSSNGQMKQFSEKNIDSVIYLKPIIDTATNLTEEDKALLRDATMHMQVKQADKVFRMTMTYPFKKIEDIEKIIKLHEGGKGFNPMRQMKGDPSVSGGMGEGMGESMPSTSNFLDMEFKKGSITRKLDEKKLEEMQKDEDMNEMKKAEPLLSQITFSTAIRLPKAITSAKGDKISVSDDKRTVLIKTNMLDMIKNPKSLEFKIEY
jgi:hypothetical protein